MPWWSDRAPICEDHTIRAGGAPITHDRGVRATVEHHVTGRRSTVRAPWIVSACALTTAVCLVVSCASEPERAGRGGPAGLPSEASTAVEVATTSPGPTAPVTTPPGTAGVAGSAGRSTDCHVLPVLVKVGVAWERGAPGYRAAALAALAEAPAHLRSAVEALRPDTWSSSVADLEAWVQTTCPGSASPIAPDRPTPPSRRALSIQEWCDLWYFTGQEVAREGRTAATLMGLYAVNTAGAPDVIAWAWADIDAANTAWQRATGRGIDTDADLAAVFNDPFIGAAVQNINSYAQATCPTNAMYVLDGTAPTTGPPGS